MILLSIGNPYDGITLVGPFDDEEDAIEYAGRHAKNDDWTTVSCLKPSN